MPHKIPDKIAESIKAHIPPTHKMWWVRGIVLATRQVSHQDVYSDLPADINTLIQLQDIDTPEDAYDVILEGKNWDFMTGDPVSLMGHEPVEATQVSRTRFLINHNSGHWGKAFPQSRTGNPLWQMTEYPKWLSCKIVTEVHPVKRGFKLALWIIIGLPLILITGGGILGCGLFILPIFYFMGKNPFKMISDNYGLSVRYVDIVPLYKSVASDLDDWIIENPDEEKGFVAAHRGRGQRGKLVE